MNDRKLVAELIFNVLAGKICAREALEQFPAGIKDYSLQCVWYALIHFEADENFRKNDIEFTLEQNNYLENLAYILQKGEPLPQNIIEEYNKYYEPMIKSETKGFINKIKSVFRFII